MVRALLAAEGLNLSSAILDAMPFVEYGLHQPPHLLQNVDGNSRVLSFGTHCLEELLGNQIGFVIRRVFLLFLHYRSDCQ